MVRCLVYGFDVQSINQLTNQATKVCKGYVECDFIMVRGGQRGGDLSRAKAVLKKDSARSTVR